MWLSLGEGQGLDSSALFPQQCLAWGRHPVSSLRAEVMSTDLGILTPRTARGFAEGGGFTHTCIRDHSDQVSALPHASRGAGDDTSLFSGSVMRWGVTAEAFRWALGSCWAPSNRSWCQLPPV